MKRRLLIMTVLISFLPLFSHAQSNEFKIAYQLGMKEMEAGNYCKAVEHFRNAAEVKNNGNPELAKKLMRECQSQCGRSSQQQAKKITPEMKYDSALVLFNEERYKEAQVILEQITKSVPEAVELLARCKEELIKQVGFIKVSDIEFGVSSPLTGLSVNFGDTIYSSDIKNEEYLALRVSYMPLDKTSRELVFSFRIYDSKGNMLIDEGNPYSRASSQWSGRTIGSVGRMRGNVIGNFPPDKYRCEMFVSDVFLFAKEFEVMTKPGEATYLTVNGNGTEITDVPPEGGIFHYDIATDADSIYVDAITLNIRERCDIQRDGNRLQVKFRPNYTFHEISDLILEVYAGGRVARIVFNQRASSPLTSGIWNEMLDSVVNNGMMIASKYQYKGEKLESKVFSKKPHNGILHFVDDNMWFIGTLGTKNEEIYGMYLSSSVDQSIQEFTSFFVGKFEKNKISEGKCYDCFGNLIFNGQFIGGFPTPPESYPQRKEYYPSDVDMQQRLEFIVEDDGSAYLGETVNGKRDGFGIVVWPNNDCWFGTWKQGHSVEGTFVDASGNDVRPDRPEDNR